jgi:hypothetical protein
MNMIVETTGEVPSPVARRRWLAYSLRLLAILVTIVAIVLAVFAREIRERWFGPRLPYKVIQNVDDLDEALRAERSVIFFDIPISIDAADGRKVFHEFAVEWRKRMPDSPISFYLLDLSERNEVVAESVDVWGLSNTKGSGELAWMCDGKPRAYTEHTKNNSHAELASIAQKAFGLSSVADFPGNPKVSDKSELWYWDDGEEGYSNPSSLSESR